MIIGVPKEIKPNEFRVALTPAGAVQLKKNGHTVYVQSMAGAGSGFTDDDYIKAGARILSSAQEVYENARLIVKVKEPLGPEYSFIKKDHIVFTYFHFASSLELTKAMMNSGAVC
ncbi:MAG TPA: alanine dehydrogenase, partial [Cytophagaceae bacterium]